jgi:hypothetical protein
MQNNKMELFQHNTMSKVRYVMWFVHMYMIQLLNSDAHAFSSFVITMVVTIKLSFPLRSVHISFYYTAFKFQVSFIAQSATLYVAD